MGDQNSAPAKKATEVRTSFKEEQKRLPDRISHRNKIKRRNIGHTEEPRDENALTVQSGEGQSSMKRFDDVDHENMSGLSTLNLNAAGGSLLHQVDDKRKQLHVDSSNVKVSKDQSLKDSLPLIKHAGSSGKGLPYSLHPVDDERKQPHVGSSDVKVSKDQCLKDSRPIIEHAGSSGKGLPYAPENWPSPGDVWTWRVGNRCTSTGFWQDRAVHSPDSLRSSRGNKMTFNSRVSLEQYIRNTFPDADIDAFFGSFIWKIPSTNAAKESLNAQPSPKTINIHGYSKSVSAVRSRDCKANNDMCGIKAQTSSSSIPAPCNICCTEPSFCTYCCCILCSRTVDYSYEGYSFIKCEAPVDENFICGHVAHAECAFRACLAGKVGGSIDLDVQYYCRLCDHKSDLLPHVEKIVKVCESIDNKDDIMKVLNLGLCMLRGSEKEKAKKLWNLISILMEKLEHGVALDEAWKMKSKIL